MLAVPRISSAISGLDAAHQPIARVGQAKL